MHIFIKFVITFLTLVLASAHDVIRPGALFISSNDKSHDPWFLRFEDGILTAGSHLATFAYDSQGSLKEEAMNRYLGINIVGLLVSEPKLFTGFKLTKESASSQIKTLSYNGDDLFQLCGDNSVAYKSTCERAILVKIFYEDHIIPR